MRVEAVVLKVVDAIGASGGSCIDKGTSASPPESWSRVAVSPSRCPLNQGHKRGHS